VATLAFGGKSATYDGFKLFGYTGFSVLTGSMQRVIPKGSLVFAKETDPNIIQNGDIITYKRSDNEMITHRVVNVYENYNDSGAKGFQTQGDMNAMPDEEVVSAANVVGVVTHSIPKVGFVLMYVTDNILLLLLVVSGLAISAVLVSMLFKGAGKKRDREDQHFAIDAV